MDLDAFRASLERASPPPGLSRELRALWLAARERWDEAHALVQDEDGPDAAWIHAHLHRREGDTANASYWYSRAGREPARGAFGAEWEAIARELCGPV